MKTLTAFAATFVAMTMLGLTVYFDDPNPWGGWFVAIWFLSLAGSLVALSAVAITRAVSEIASGGVAVRAQERRAQEASRLT